MIKLKNIVIATRPRNGSASLFVFFGILSAFIVWFDFFVVVPVLMDFSHKIPTVKTDKDTIKVLCDLFFVFVFVSFSIAAIRNNTRSQPVEAIILFLGFVVLIFFAVLSSPLLFLWAHVHGYHFDHYEAARRGGWYIFRLNGT